MNALEFLKEKIREYDLPKFFYSYAIAKIMDDYVDYKKGTGIVDKEKIIKQLGNMLTLNGFPSTSIEDHKEKITRKYFQRVLNEFEEQIKHYVRELKQ